MIITILGPTGTGKTTLSLELAKKYNAEIINADSTQIYKEMNIGTAKIKDFENITHHLINIKNLNEDYTIYQYQKEGREIIENLLKQNKNIIIVGGSGLYINALLYDYKLKEEENIIINKDIQTMHKELTNLGIDIHINNKQRIERLYKRHIINKEPIIKERPKAIYDSIIIGLYENREILYENINKRTDEMIKEGLLEEVKELYNKYPDSKQLKSTIGYKELILYLNNTISLEEAIEKIKQNSRNYAKRQFTWFNNQMKVNWFKTDYNNFNNTINQVINFIENQKIK